jgi:hypothetical protein
MHLWAFAMDDPSLLGSFREIGDIFYDTIIHQYCFLQPMCFHKSSYFLGTQ